MGIFDLFRRNREAADEVKAAPSRPAPYPLTSTDNAWLWQLIGAPASDAGTLQVTVNEETAMNCTAVRAAVQAIAEAVGQLPLVTYKRGADGAKDRATDHPIYSFLRNRASEIHSAQWFKEQLTRDALLYGNGYALISRSTFTGNLTQLWHIPPSAVKITLRDKTWEPIYTVHYGDGTTQEHPPSDIFHLMGPSLNGYSGASPIQQGKGAIELAMLLEEHGRALFRNRARPDGLFSLDGTLNAAAAAANKEGLKTAIAGRNNYSALVGVGIDKYIPISFTSVDSQFLELRRFSVTEIARLFRVPPHMLFDLERGTWANTSEMGAEFLTYSLRPWLARWENEVAMKLFSEAERDTYFAEFLADDLTRMDIAARADAYGKLIAARVLNPNEARARENLPPYADGKAFVNPNTTSSTFPDNRNNDGPSHSA